MNVCGFSWIYPALMSLTIFAGSVEFIAVNLLLGSFNPIQAFILTFIVNARHLFYGISMLEKYRGLGLKKFYLSFSINYTAKIPEGVDRGLFYFWITFLNQLYWVSGATLGGIFGSLIKFDTHGLEFILTSLFVVIFLEQFLQEKKSFERADRIFGKFFVFDNFWSRKFYFAEHRSNFNFFDNF